MLHTVDLTGDCRTTVYAAARRLLAEGADPADTIETYRGGKLSMSGVIGKFAALTVAENDHGNPTLQLRPYKPFPTVRLAATAPKTGLPATLTPPEATQAVKRVA